jgi:hypothetical protein
MNARRKQPGKSTPRAKSSLEVAISPAAPLERGLGQREREVMSILWERGSSNVQEVSDMLSASLA